MNINHHITAEVLLYNDEKGGKEYCEEAETWGLLVLYPAIFSKIKKKTFVLRRVDTFTSVKIQKIVWGHDMPNPQTHSANCSCEAAEL